MLETINTPKWDSHQPYLLIKVFNNYGVNLVSKFELTKINTALSIISIEIEKATCDFELENLWEKLDELESKLTLPKFNGHLKLIKSENFNCNSVY